ncbi:MAG: ribonuclease E/G, partial [Lachnospiraceae bacterium]|nr:ribonuclease E/G [Lachnospiraceae bacterium]
MYDKIIFSNALTEHDFCFKFKDDVLESIELCEADSIISNVYVGVIGDYVSNINAVFVNFGTNGKYKGFISLNDGPLIYLNNKNSDKPCRGDRVLVQVLADKVKTKDYTLTCNVNLNGRYLVMTKTAKHISISKKINNQATRKILKESLCRYSDKTGFIVRTNAAKASVEDLTKDAEMLIELYDSIYNDALTRKIGECVYASNSDYGAIATDSVNKGCKRIYTDSVRVYDLIRKTFDNAEIHYSEDDTSGVILKLYRNHDDLNVLFSVDSELKKSLSPKVWLKSGAYLIIEHTEALHVIDINTGKVIKKGDRETTFLNINLEAARAVMREIKKRNLTGIIIVDFINMKSEESKNILLSELKKMARQDDVNTSIIGFTGLGLVEITR